MSAGRFTVTDHQLDGCWVGPSPNQGDGMVPRVVVLHYTAMHDVEAVQRWLCNPESQVSAHLIIDRSGGVRQIVRFDRIAWHAGKSRWRNVEGVNQCSIGIELVNLGWLDQITPAGCTREDLDICLPEERVIRACHANGTEDLAWERFAEAQLEALDGVMAALKKAYPSIEAVVGHDEIAPDRKEDPGPAFPMERYR